MRSLCSFLLGCLACLAPARADSPLTSTDFWKAYQDVPQVKQADDIRRLNTELGNYLLSNASLDKKAAVINALSWNVESQMNAPLFLDRLQEKYHGAAEARMTADETFCLAYLTALDRYQTPDDAQKLMARARQKLPGSFTVQIVYALLQAQRDFSQQNRLWADVAPVFANTHLKRDMRPKGRAIIQNYMLLYKKP